MKTWAAFDNIWQQFWAPDQERAYQLALMFYRAGKEGAPMPEPPSKEASGACIAAYEAGKRYA